MRSRQRSEANVKRRVALEEVAFFRKVEHYTRPRCSCHMTRERCVSCNRRAFAKRVVDKENVLVRCATFLFLFFFSRPKHKLNTRMSDFTNSRHCHFFNVPLPDIHLKNSPRHKVFFLLSKRAFPEVQHLANCLGVQAMQLSIPCAERRISPSDGKPFIVCSYFEWMPTCLL